MNQAERLGRDLVETLIVVILSQRGVSKIRFLFKKSEQIAARWEFVSELTLYSRSYCYVRHTDSIRLGKRREGFAAGSASRVFVLSRTAGSWIRPFRRMRRAIVVTLRLIESSCRIIDACETIGGGASAPGRPSTGAGLRPARRGERTVGAWRRGAERQRTTSSRARRNTPATLRDC